MDAAQMEARIAELGALIASLQEAMGEKDARIRELEAQVNELQEELRRRGKSYRPKPNRKRSGAEQDRRRKPHRKHPGSTRPRPDIPDAECTVHDVRPEACPCCQGRRLTPTGIHVDHDHVDIPPQQPQIDRYRLHEFQCDKCGHVFHSRGEHEIPHGHIGPRARLFACYARGYLGISLEKTCTLLEQLWGISVSRPAVLGHLQWGGELMAPVVQQFLLLLQQADVVHADETGWRIDGRNVWAWSFSNSRLAVFLIDHSRSGEVLVKALGDTLPGVLVSDFYAAYNRIDAVKQRCLTHLLRELHALTERLPARYVTIHIRPLIELFQDAIHLAARREAMSEADYTDACNAIYERFAVCADRDSNHIDVRRIYKRLNKYVDELFTFLDRPEVPADNNAAERDIRSIAAARSDGGVSRSNWGARAFANIKSVVRTCQKRGVNFFEYGMQLVQATLSGQPPPLPESDA